MRHWFSAALFLGFFTCFPLPCSASVARVDYLIRDNFGGISSEWPRAEGFDEGAVVARALDSTTFYLDRTGEIRRADATVDGVVGGNGLNGLGLIRLETSVSQFYFQNPSPRYPHQPLPSTTNYLSSISGSWSDTLHLTNPTPDPVYLKVQVSGVLSNSIFDLGVYEFGSQVFRRSRAGAEIGVDSGGNRAFAAVGSEYWDYWFINPLNDELDNLLISGETHEGWHSFSAEPGAPVSDGSSFTFVGTALLPVYASDDLGSRQFTLYGNVFGAVTHGVATADLGHTISFLGVTDASGNPISGASFASGLQPAAVPEPSTICLALLAVACLLLRRGGGLLNDCY